MENKKNFFSSLEPKSALIVGAIAGVLTICTVGFFILLFLQLSGRVRAIEADKSALSAGADGVIGDLQPAVVKSDKPLVELFVMSYCPFGVQTQKAMLPVMDLLRNKAEIYVRFVSYAMHGWQEIEENSRQFCLQKEHPAKFTGYLKCFTEKGDYKACLASSGANSGAVESCIKKTDQEFGVTDKYKNQNAWLNGRFPPYPVQEDLNRKYGVQGSPTLIINGAEVAAGRNPEALKKAICDGFSSPPAECQKALSAAPASSGFGNGAGTEGGDAGCGA